MNPSQILFGPAPTSNSCGGGVVAAWLCVLFAGWRIRQKIFSFFFGARCAHAVCPGSHLWESTGIIKNHQPINFFLSCGQYPASPRTFFSFSIVDWLFILLVKKKRKFLFIYLHGASEESWPRRRWAVDHHLSGFVCGFFKSICIVGHAMKVSDLLHRPKRISFYLSAGVLLWLF